MVRKLIREGRLPLEDPERDVALEARRVWRALGLYRQGRELARAGVLPVLVEPAQGLLVLRLATRDEGDYWALAGTERVGVFGNLPGAVPLEGGPRTLGDVRRLVEVEGIRYRLLLSAEAEEALGLLLS